MDVARQVVPNLLAMLETTRWERKDLLTYKSFICQLAGLAEGLSGSESSVKGRLVHRNLLTWSLVAQLVNVGT